MIKRLVIILCAAFIACGAIVSAQNPQTSDVSGTQPLMSQNVKYVDGAGIGFWPTAGSGLTLNLTAGTGFCSGAVTDYAGGTLTMADGSTNNVYIDAGTCNPTTKTTSFDTSDIPLAVVTTSGGAITDIKDLRLVNGGAGSSGGGGGGGSVNSVTGTANQIASTGGANPVLSLPNAVIAPGTLTANAIWGSLNSVGFSATPAFDASLGNLQTTTLTGNVSSSTISNAANGQQLYFEVCQDGTGGRTFTWPTNVKGAPVVIPTASFCTTASFVYDGSNWQGLPTPYDMSTVAFSATPVFDASKTRAGVFKITITGNVTSSTLTNLQPGMRISFLVCEDSSGGRAFVPPTNVTGWIPVSTSPNACTQQSFVSDGTNAYTSNLGGSIVASPQYQIPYYSALGTGSTLTGSSSVTTDASGNLNVNGTGTSSIIMDDGVGHTLTLSLPGSMSATYTWTFPGGALPGSTSTICISSAGLISYGCGAGGSVTSIATTSPITGGTITSTGTIACATCVTASSPGAGVAHFAGSTQAVTSSAVVGSDMTNNTVTSTQLAVVNTRRVCTIVVGADNGAAALADADIAPQGRQCFIPAASTVVEVDVAADAGTPSVQVNKITPGGSQTNLLSGALSTAASGGVACSNTGGTTGIDGTTTCTNTLTTTALAAGVWLETRTATAGGVAKRFTVSIVSTIN